MKFFNIALLFVIFVLACSSTFAQDDAAGPKRIALRRPAGKSVKPTTAAPPPPADEEEGDYGEENQDNQYADEAEEGAGGSSSTTTSTEAPKKIGPVIRPFRSNDDFLNSLKRRQMNAKKHRAEKPTPKSKPVAAAVEEGDEAEESAPAQAAAPAKGFKAGHPSLNRNRKLTKPTKAEAPAEDAAAEESEQQKEESKLKRPLSSRLALRKRA